VTHRRRTKRAAEPRADPPFVTFQVRERSLREAVKMLKQLMRGGGRISQLVLRAEVWK